MTTSNTYELAAISPSEGNRIRRSGGEIYVADHKPGFPCRQCLMDAEIGEELILVSYDPFESTSPYRSASPIFIHRHDCGEPPAGGGSLPDQLLVRQLSVRAFDDDEMMVDAAVVQGVDLDKTLLEMLHDDEVTRLHVHNANRGCFAVRVNRVTTSC